MWAAEGVEKTECLEDWSGAEWKPEEGRLGRMTGDQGEANGLGRDQGLEFWIEGSKE